MKIIIILLFFAFYSCAQTHTFVIRKDINKVIKNIRSKALKVSIAEGAFLDENGGYEEVFCYLKDTVHIYEYYDNKDNLTFEKMFFFDKKPIYYEIIKTSNYHHRQKYATYYGQYYLKDNSIIYSNVRGEKIFQEDDIMEKIARIVDEINLLEKKNMFN